MKRITASGLSIAIGLAAATAPASASQPEGAGARSGPASAIAQERLEGTMRGMPMMMHGMSMNAHRDATGLERPLLSLALKNRTELELSSDQEKSLQDMVDRFGKAANRSRREIGTIERELGALLKQEPIDMPQVGVKARAIETLRADLRLGRIRTIADGLAVLTPGQRNKLDAIAAGRGGSGQGDSTRGAEEMHRFMSSERMPQAMSAMMAMAERMGGGDTMLGMVRMMEMMSMMGGGSMGGGKGSEGMTEGGMMGNRMHDETPSQERK